MNKVNAEMLVLARELRGVTQAQLAAAVSVTQATISRYEAGLIDVPADHLRVIAEYLGRPVSFFYWQERLYGASCLYHRKNRRLSATELQQIHAKVNLLRLQAARLLKRAAVRSRYKFHRLDPNKLGGPAESARRLRQLWQFPPGPVRNVVKSIEAAGGMVFRCPFGVTRVDGISQWAADEPDMPPVFFVHDDISGDRARLTLAHEIGHVVMHHTLTDGDPEDEANLFAAEFTMPAAEIGPELTGLTLPKAAALKSYWKVSMQSLIVRARQLGKISDSQYQYLFRQVGMKGYRTAEPMPIPPEEPEMFRELLTYHRQRHGLGAAEMSELLGETKEGYADQYGQRLSGFRLVG